MQGADHTWVNAGFLELSSFANLYVFFPDPALKDPSARPGYSQRYTKATVVNKTDSFLLLIFLRVISAAIKSLRKVLTKQTIHLFNTRYV